MGQRLAMNSASVSGSGRARSGGSGAGGGPVGRIGGNLRLLKWRAYGSELDDKGNVGQVETR